ncbi:MAG: sulfite exporter TauE/SafE family protein [Alphaproteobacteria bacterium]
MDPATWILLPPDMSWLTAAIMVVASFFTSALTAAIGLGGGAALLAIMANFMPITALVPVHGAVQVGSNAGRVVVQFAHINWSLLGWFALGGMLGAWLGGQIVVTLPDAPLRLGIAGFLLWAVWAPKPNFKHLVRGVMTITGFFATLLAMFFGVSGPVVGAVLAAQDLAPRSFVANQAACSLLVHVVKILVFGLLGFSYGQWWALIGAMVATGFAGTLAGSHLLNRLPGNRFKLGFRIIMTLLAGNLVVQAVTG